MGEFLANLLMFTGVTVVFISVPAMLLLNILMIGETNEDLEPFSDWIIFSWGTLVFRPESLSAQGLRYRRWYFRFLFAAVTAIVLAVATAKLRAS